MKGANGSMGSMSAPSPMPDGPVRRFMLLVGVMMLPSLIAGCLEMAPHVPHCGWALTTNVSDGAEGRVFTFDHVARPHRLVDVHYDFSLENATSGPAIPSGSFASAAAANDTATVRYVDVTPSHMTVDEGDSLIVRTDQPVILNVRDAAGNLIGGSVPCD